MIPEEVFLEYGLNKEAVDIAPFGSGLINNTWKLTSSNQAFILQRINQEVFKHPPDIALNIDLVGAHLQEHHPDYLFISPIRTREDRSMVHAEGQGYFRLFPFLSGSHTIDVVQTADQAYEAATQFGRFTRLLSSVNVHELKNTIPAFHDLSLRYEQFQTALQKGNPARIKEAAPSIKKLETYANLVRIFKKIQSDPGWSLRVMHHDTKISNVLFDETGKALCVIDLDTIMPGYFISDVGDMMRTYLSPVSEEEQDMGKIEVRPLFYKAIVAGYEEEMKDELTPTEKEHFFYAGQFMIYMQALRFLTDYLNNDTYYGAKYEGHNLIRANNQVVLLEKLMQLTDE